MCAERMASACHFSLSFLWFQDKGLVGGSPLCLYIPIWGHADLVSAVPQYCDVTEPRFE